MTVALIGLGGAILGVLSGGGVQLFVAHRQRKADSRRAARLLFADLWIGSSAVRSLRDLEYWWAEEVKPRLEDWYRYREALAGGMWGPDFQTVDGAFTRIAELERWRVAGMEPADMVRDAREADEQAYRAAGLLLRHGFRHREYRAAVREMERWPRQDAAENGGEATEPVDDGNSQ